MNGNLKNLEIVQIPRLVTVSARTEQEIEFIMRNVEKNIDDVEYTRLLHEAFSKDIDGHLYRGYILPNTNGQITKSKKLHSGEKRPIWFLYSCLGSQWPAMGKSLMQIPIFAKSIRNSHQILLSKGLDLIKIVTDDDPKIFDEIVHWFVGITAIQIALTDTLVAIGLEPDGYIGHSHGELTCAYADGCLTAEQTLLIAYFTGSITAQHEFVPCMAAGVRLPYEDLVKIIPPEVDICSHNGPYAHLIGGPKEVVRNFINGLKEKDIFVYELNTMNKVFHNRHMTTLTPKFIPHFKSIIPEPKLRSKRWISTSALEKDWNTDRVKYSSAEFHAENLLQPVYFEEASHHIPNNAVFIEVAPHALLMPVTEMLFPDSVEKIGLMKRSHENNAEYFLNALGQIYEMGFAMKLDLLYPPVDLPVGNSASIISPQVKWQYEEAAINEVF